MCTELRSSWLCNQRKDVQEYGVMFSSFHTLRISRMYLVCRGTCTTVGEQCSCHAMQVYLNSRSTRDGHDWYVWKREGRSSIFAPSSQPVTMSANLVGLRVLVCDLTEERRVWKLKRRSVCQRCLTSNRRQPRRVREVASTSPANPPILSPWQLLDQSHPQVALASCKLQRTASPQVPGHPDPDDPPTLPCFQKTPRWPRQQNNSR